MISSAPPFVLRLSKNERRFFSRIIFAIGTSHIERRDCIGGSLGAARDYQLPTMAVIFNNKKYAAMQGMHQKMYPDGIAAEIDLYHGTHINAPDFVKAPNALAVTASR